MNEWVLAGLIGSGALAVGIGVWWVVGEYRREVRERDDERDDDEPYDL
jgi:hypothetical protein